MTGLVFGFFCSLVAQFKTKIMSVIIIEDEKPSARRLQRMLSDLGTTADVMLHSVEESIEWLCNNPHPELVFLDIQLSDGLSFEIFDVVDLKSAVIFTTAYDEYALKAFKLNSVDYLLKPIDEDDLAKAFKKFNENFKPAQVIDLSEIKSLMEERKTPTYKSRFTSKVGSHIKVFHIQEIECFYSENKGTYLHNNDNRSYLLDTKLEELDVELDPKEFFRVSRKFIVSFKAIDDIVSYSNSRLKVKLKHYNEQDIIVSRERVKEFKSWLE